MRGLNVLYKETQGESQNVFPLQSNISTDSTYVAAKKDTRGSTGFTSWLRLRQTFYHSMQKADICEIRKNTPLRMPPTAGQSQICKAKWHTLWLLFICITWKAPPCSHILHSIKSLDHSRKEEPSRALVNRWCVIYVALSSKSSLCGEDTHRKFSYGPYEEVGKAPIFPLYWKQQKQHAAIKGSSEVNLKHGRRTHHQLRAPVPRSIPPRLPCPYIGAFPNSHTGDWRAPHASSQANLEVSFKGRRNKWSQPLRQFISAEVPQPSYPDLNLESACWRPIWGRWYRSEPGTGSINKQQASGFKAEETHLYFSRRVRIWIPELGTWPPDRWWEAIFIA